RSHESLGAARGAVARLDLPEPYFDGALDDIDGCEVEAVQTTIASQDVGHEPFRLWSSSLATKARAKKARVPDRNRVLAQHPGQRGGIDLDRCRALRHQQIA